jgi:hypothetical protein
MDDNKPDKHLITASAVIPARRERVYALIANYHDGHPRIVPKQFSSLVVEQGGIGAGTVIRFSMSVFGRKLTFRAAVSEPEPGRVLVETDLDANGAVTTFTVDQGPAPADSRVTISYGAEGTIRIPRHYRKVSQHSAAAADVLTRTGESGPGRNRAIWRLETFAFGNY